MKRRTSDDPRRVSKALLIGTGQSRVARKLQTTARQRIHEQLRAEVEARRAGKGGR